MVNERGSLQVLLALFLVVLFIGGMGVLGLFRLWRFQVETQFRLNQCVGIAAHSLRDTLNSLVSLNGKIRRLRAAIAAIGWWEPWLRPPLEAALEVVVVRQDFLKVKWNLQRQKWSLTNGCGNRRDHALPLPELHYVRDPPDDLGPQPLHWEGEPPGILRIAISHQARAAVAELGGDIDEGILGQRQDWVTRWGSAASGFEWAGSY